MLFIALHSIAISIIVFYLQVLRKSSGKLQICVKISVCKRFSSKIIFLLRKFIISLQRVFHGIRFKVRGLVVVRQLIFFLRRFLIKENKMNSELKEEATPQRPAGFWRRAWDLYADGFRNMTVGRYLWAIIIFKLIVIFLVLKLFFFPDLLSTNFDNDRDRAEAVRSALTNPKE